MEIWLGMGAGMILSIIYLYMKSRNKAHIDLGGLTINATRMSQDLEDVIENSVKLRFEMNKAGYSYVNGNLEKEGREYTGRSMYVRRYDNHVRLFKLEHGIWTEQSLEGALSELEQLP